LPLLTGIANFTSTALITSLTNNMIQISNPLRRNTLTPALSALVAAGLLATSAQAAKTDAQILAFRTAAESADIEAISSLGGDVADKFGTGEIKSNNKNIKSLANFGANAIIAKPEATTGPTRPDNKADEVAELGATIQDGMQADAKYIANKKKIGVKRTVTMMKGLLKTAKKTATLFGTTIFRDAAGSVALTIRNDPALDLVEEKIQAGLLKLSKKIAGKVNRTAIQTGFTEGFDSVALEGGAANTKYEDGNIDALTRVADPETDIRPA
jgi:hypothetical protein